MAGVYKLTLILSFLLVIYFTAMAVLDIIARIAHWRHRRKADARIIAQAKGAGVWDKKPIVLGGRALELKAWEDFKIKREPGEPDAHLRRRCMTVAGNELASSTATKKERHDELDAYAYLFSRQIGKTLNIPPEILGSSKTDTENKGESENE